MLERITDLLEIFCRTLQLPRELDVLIVEYTRIPILACYSSLFTTSPFRFDFISRFASIEKLWLCHFADVRQTEVKWVVSAPHKVAYMMADGDYFLNLQVENLKLRYEFLTKKGVKEALATSDTFSMMFNKRLWKELKQHDYMIFRIEVRKEERSECEEILKEYLGPFDIPVLVRFTSEENLFSADEFVSDMQHIFVMQNKIKRERFLVECLN